MSNKTISINPSLFSIGGSKTKKNREKKQKPTIVPLISPNVLKNKLLKRIKEHKQRETENLENNKRKLPTPEESIKNDIVKHELSTFSDEFSDSINYLQTLSKQKKVNDEKINYERQKQRKKELLERQTVRNYQSINQPHIEHNVNLDLPEELLARPLIVVNTDSMPIGGQPIQLHTKTSDSIPYGILKGGTKPTYKDWARTQRNYDVTNPHAALTIQGLELNKEKNERENRLNNLREKLKQKQVEESINKSEDNMLTQNLIQKPVEVETPEKSVENVLAQPVQNVVPINVGGGEEIIATKKITKKTIKRKYTLGRSKIKKTVSVLVKDRGTRKLILGAQKDLKRKSINDVKEYLRDHNLIKIGSNAPNDVLRKLYESAMLAGEITNSNSEILLHNFSKDDKEL
jgi:hypothetical protein